MAKDQSKRFLGTGWSFPPTFSKQTKGVVMLSDEENIAKSVKIIVLTQLGERVFHPNLGTNINDFMFSRNINSPEKHRLERMIEFAIAENEFRVNVDKVDVTNNQAKDGIEISVAYTIKANNSKYNMVFPFYYEDGVKM